MFDLLAQYNEWMNTRLYGAASALSGDALATDRGAYFGSIMGTLNHILVGDIIWLKRFAHHPAGFRCLDPVRALAMPAGLTAQLSAQLPLLAEQRRVIDGVLNALAAAATPADLQHVLTYHNTQGVAAHKRFDRLLLHVFNHQTHHRGQVTTLLSQAGIDLGATDLVVLVPDSV